MKVTIGHEIEVMVEAKGIVADRYIRLTVCHDGLDSLSAILTKTEAYLLVDAINAAVNESYGRKR